VYTLAASRSVSFTPKKKKKEEKHFFSKTSDASEYSIKQVIWGRIIIFLSLP